MSKIVINGKEFNLPSGANIQITTVGDIKVNGDVIGGDTQSKTITVSITGDVGSISTASGDITVNGNVAGGVSTASGDVRVSNSIGGAVSTASGDVKAKSINGNVTTMSGDIYADAI